MWQENFNYTCKKAFSGTLGSFGFHVRENQIFFLIIKAKFKQNNKVIRSYFLSLSGGVWEENKTVALWGDSFWDHSWKIECPATPVPDKLTISEKVINPFIQFLKQNNDPNYFKCFLVLFVDISDKKRI